MIKKFLYMSFKKREHRGSWKPLYGGKEVYPENYNGITIPLVEKILPQRKLNIVFRRYDEGLYNKVPASEIKFNCELPLTVISADSIGAVIAVGGVSS